jgi:hypothetical protein
VGISKSTVLRAIVSHRISATKTETGDWQIDASELFRVFPPVRNGEDRAAERAPVRGATAAERHETALFEAQIAALRETSELLRRQLDDVRDDREHWRTMAEASQRLLAPPEPKPWWHWMVRR